MDGTRRLTFRRFRASLAALLLASAASGADKIRFNIPADVFPRTMLEFYHQSNVEILFLSTSDLYRIHTQPVKGEFTPEQALQRLLAATGLVYEFDGTRSVIVKKPGQDSIYFDIPAGVATDELNEWGRQAGAQLLFDFNVVKGYNTRPVKGPMSRIDALLRMLSGSPLVATQVDEQTYAVDKKGPDNPNSPRFADTRRRIRQSMQTVEPAAGMDEILIASNHGLTERWGLEELPRVVYDRTDIDASAASTVQDFAATIPQVWGGGPNEYSQLGREGLTNSTGGTGFNYLALGAESTLILVDGVRPAASGIEAGWWDISLLPLSAIERIEILPENAPGRYGLNAIGGVVNFVTRSDFEGAETQVQAGGATSGGGAERRLSQLLGKRWSNLEASLLLDYSNRDAVPAADRGQATSDLTRWGGGNWNSPYGYPGTLMTSTGQTWAITGIADGRPLLGPPGSSNTYDMWQSRDILSSQRRMSAMGRVSWALEDARVWSNFWVSDRHLSGSLGEANGTTISLPSTNPGYVNPLGGTDPVFVQYGVSHLLGPITNESSALAASAAAGLTLERQNWRFELSGQLGLERDRLLLSGYPDAVALQDAVSSIDPSSVMNPFLGRDAVDAAELAGINQVYYYQSYSRLKSADVAITRTLPVSSGDASFSVGAQYREEILSSLNSAMPPDSAWQSTERAVSSAYAGVDLPLVGKKQAIPLVASLNLFAGWRYEHYSDGEAMAAPSILLAWSPTPALTLKGTFRRGFRPPALTERSTATNFSELVPLPDGRTALGEIGGNPNIAAERARISTAGVELRPSPGVRLSATYYSVVSSGRAFQPLLSVDLSSFHGRVIANPTAAQVAAICTESTYVTAMGESCGQTQPDLYMDLRLQSLERLKASGANLATEVSLNHWRFRFDGTHLFAYRGTGLDGAILEELNTLNNPVDLRARATVTRESGPITLSVSANFTGSYRDTINQPQRRIGSWTTIDLAASYRPAGVPLLEGAQLFVGARNLMNRQPPFANNVEFAAGWDPENGGNLADRVVSGEIRWTW